MDKEQNLTWDFSDERARLHALAGTHFGDAFADALPLITEKKTREAHRTAKTGA